MKNEVVYNPKGVYEDDDVIIVAGKNDDELTFMCYDKKERETLPLGACIFCNKEVG